MAETWAFALALFLFLNLLLNVCRWDLNLGYSVTILKSLPLRHNSKVKVIVKVFIF